MTLDFQDNTFDVSKGVEPSGGGGTSDHAQLTNLSYASSGHTGFLSSADFLSGGTKITVDASGNGDYTKIEDAIAYLTGKWSNGNITIEIKNGTYNISNQIAINPSDFYFQSLIIQGENKTNTIINVTTDDQFGFYVEGIGTSIIFKTITVKKQTASSTFVGAFFVSQGAFVKLSDVVANSFYWGLLSARGATTSITDFTGNNLGEGMRSNLGDIMLDKGTLTLSNISSYGLFVAGGGTIKVYQTVKSFTSVASEANISIGTVAGTGMFLGFWGS